MADTSHSDVQKQLIAHAAYARKHMPNFSLKDLDTFMLFDQNKIRAKPPVLEILKWDCKHPAPTKSDLAKITEEDINNELVDQKNTIEAVRSTPLALTQARLDTLYACPVGTVVYNIDTHSLWAYTSNSKWENLK